MRKLKILVAVMVLLPMLTGCGILLEAINEHLYTDTYGAVKYTDQYQDSWRYQQLNATHKEYYGSIYTAVMDTVNTDSKVEFVNEYEEITIVDGVRIRFPQAKMTKEDIVLLFQAIFRDNPQFFYLSREYRMEGHNDNEGSSYYDTIILQYNMPLEQRTAAITTFDNAVENILKDVPIGDDQYETELFLYDRLAKHCTYTDASSADSDKNPMPYSAYGALVNQSAVCEGYAKAMQLLLTRCHIAATSVSGDALWSNESHMWNLVTINGQNYYLDPTWNDDQDAGAHTYFNITTEMLNRTHKVNEENLSLPQCTAIADNYFVRSGTYIDTYERKKIAKIIADRILNGDTTIQLQFTPKTFDNGLLFIKNSNLIFDMVNEHLTAHGKELWNFTLLTNKEAYNLTIVKAK